MGKIKLTNESIMEFLPNDFIIGDELNEDSEKIGKCLYSLPGEYSLCGIIRPINNNTVALYNSLYSDGKVVPLCQWRNENGEIEEALNDSIAMQINQYAGQGYKYLVDKR